MAKCSPDMTFEECELAIVRSSVEYIEQKTKRLKLKDPQVKTIITIVESFLKKSKCICYGGTAINNILPSEDQFYDKNIEFPDYDVYSPKPVEHAKQLANIYYNKGFQSVEAKAGVHFGTYKVFVNFLPVADITYLHPSIYKQLLKKSIMRSGIYYASPTYLRMSMYLELSRPLGHISRWEKIVKRISIFNKHYPLKGVNCSSESIQRMFESVPSLSNFIFEKVKHVFVQHQVVFFGAMAQQMYSPYLHSSYKTKFGKVPDFDVLSDKPDKLIQDIEKQFDSEKYTVTYIVHDGIGEIISEHYELQINREPIAFIYKPLACHSYNVVKQNKQHIRIATIDTMLSFYLAFLFVNRYYYNHNRILCMSEYLFHIQQKHRLSQKGVLKRFTMKCIGKQDTIETIFKRKNEKYKQLKNNKTSIEYESWFLRYVPNEEETIIKPSHQKRETKKKQTNVKKYRKKTKRNKS